MLPPECSLWYGQAGIHANTRTHRDKRTSSCANSVTRADAPPLAYRKGLPPQSLIRSSKHAIRCSLERAMRTEPDTQTRIAATQSLVRSVALRVKRNAQRSDGGKCSLLLQRRPGFLERRQLFALSHSLRTKKYTQKCAFSGNVTAV